MTKAIAFRPTEKTEAIIKAYMEEKNLNPTQAINEIIVKAHNKQVIETTGVYIHCPRRPLPIPLQNPLVTWKTPVDSSICRTCPAYPCEEWKRQFSYERMIKTAQHIPTPDIKQGS